MTMDEIFGESVATVRGLKGLSQRQLCGLLAELGFGIDPPALSRIESGSRSVRLSEAASIAEALEIDLSALTSGISSTDIESRLGEWSELQSLRAFRRRVLEAVNG